MAEACGISLAYLHEIFRGSARGEEATIFAERLERAGVTLRSPDHAGLQIATITYRLGFSDPAHFARAFAATSAPHPATGDPALRRDDPAGGDHSLGAYMATEVVGALPAMAASHSWAASLAILGAALLAAVLVTGLAGLIFEIVIIRRVYGSHLRQILITVGGLIVMQELLVAVWGANPIPVQKPAALQGSVVIAGAPIEIFRIVAVGLGVAVYAGLWLLLSRTPLGLTVRAGVENLEMVEALGFRVKRLFVGVFVAGTALAGVGGVMWGIYQGLVTPSIGPEMMILVFIILIMGDMGSVGGAFVAAILVGLITNYTGFLLPKLALGSNILLMVAVLLWRPRGLFPLVKS